MGVTIHYRGKIDAVTRIQELVSELSEIGTVLGWEVVAISNEDGEADQSGVEGVILSPMDGTESIPFLFDGEGNLRSLIALYNDDADYTYYVAVKTQFGETETHSYLVGLLHYLKKKYLSALSVNDEGGFWERGSLDELRRRKEFLQKMIDRFQDEASGSESDGEDVEKKIVEIFERLRGDLED